MWRARHHLFICLMFSYGRIVWLKPPELDRIPKPVVSLSESEKREQVLVSGLKCKDPDGEATRVYVRSVHPSHPCGRCFQIWPCANKKGYCLMFLPTSGRLLFDSVSSYTVQVTCADDAEHYSDSDVIEVQLKANTAPNFTDPGPTGASVEIKSAIAAHPGYLVYDVNANDVDDDVLFYTLFTDTSADFFDIGYADGKIRVTRDLRYLCDDSVTFRVLVADSHHPPVGPAVVEAVFKKRNHSPVIKNKKTEFAMPENTPFSLKVDVDDVDGDDVIFKMTAAPEQALEYYAINDAGTIKSRKPLDYENPLLRNVDLYIDVTDGFCDAETFRVTVEVTDVNEPPIIKPDYVERTVYEGFISVDPEWTVLDPDSSETHTWTALQGGSGDLVIDSATGFIHSKGEIDVDPATEKKYVFKVQVRDKDDLKDTAVLRLTVLDKNDHAPTFHRQLYEFSISPCTKAGAILGIIHARDKDSHLQGNHALVYSGTGRNISVLATGEVILMQQCTPGDVETIQGFVTDQGTYPGPLSGIPTTVFVKCNPCPPEPVTTEATSNSTANDNSTLATDDPDSLTANLAWIMPAILLALSLAGLLAYVISEYCCRACAMWRAKRSLQKNCVKPAKQRWKKKPTPQKEQAILHMKPAPPVLPPAEPEPFFFGFWKETYVDRDQRAMPRRDAIPASVEQDQAREEEERKEKEKEKEQRRLERQIMEEKYRAELKKYNQEIQAISNGCGRMSRNMSLSSTAPLTKKRKVCTVL